jgi:Alginate lyase
MASTLLFIRRVTVILALLFAYTIDARHHTTKTTSSANIVKSYPTGTSIPTSAPTKWVHPGVFVEKPQLDFVAGKVQDGEQPWSVAFSSMLDHKFSSPTRTADPYSTVICGPSSSPNIGCFDERNDSMAAYMNALAWWITKSTAYADKAIYYMNAWSSTLKAHLMSNAPLQSAWSAANWVRAGEIIRHSTDQAWPSWNMAAFEDMLKTVYLPIIIGGKVGNGNWELGIPPNVP